jgi:hypothetical protein
MLAVPERIVDCGAEVFKQNFNRHPHEVQHALAANPLFQLSALAELAQRVSERKNPHHPKGDMYFDVGTVDPHENSRLCDRPKNIA